MTNRYNMELKRKLSRTPKVPSVKAKRDEVMSIAGVAGTRVKMVASKSQQVDGEINPILEAESSVRRRCPLESPYKCILKRLLDITVSFITILAIHLWLIPVIGAIIRLTSKGPAIFRQKRIGKDGKVFVIYKFRTMATDHHRSKKEALAGIGEITKENDSRLTPIGALLRKANIDEFPQFFNVLIGNMSLVGPRPHMVSEDMHLEENLEGYALRRRVKPGITGWAQVNGYRGGTNDMTLMQKRTDYDIWYIENWSIWLDIRIIVRTFWQVVLYKRGCH